MKRPFLLACVLLLACGSSSKTPPAGPTTELDGSRGPGASGPSGTPGNSDPDDVHPHTECLDPSEVFVLASVWQAPPPALSGDGTTELPLSPKGCVRLVRTVQAGRVTALSVRRWGGYVSSNLKPTSTDFRDLKFFEYEQVYLDSKTASDGSLEVVFDIDGDQQIDGRLSESYQGESIARQEFTRFNDAMAIAERRTLSAVNADTIHYKVERLQNGALATLTDFDAPSLQKQNIGCYLPPPGANDVVPCSDEQKQMLRQRMKTAIERGVACFDKHERGGSIEQFRLFLFYQLHGDDIEIECFQSDTYWGEMAIGSKGPKLRVNAQLLGCEMNNQDFIDSTLFHEVLHQIRGPHDEHDNELGPERGPFGPRANAYTDSIRGCEELCFGTIKNVCSCAACFRSNACDSRCSSMGSCVAHDPMGTATMSEAVGALCQDPAAVPAKQKKSTWHTTMMDCQSNCSFGAAQCKSYSLSCDHSCQ